MNWVFKRSHPETKSVSQQELYGDLWPMVRYLRANEWSVFIVPPSERRGDMIYRVGTKLMTADGLTATYHRVYERNERAKALAAREQQGKATPRGNPPVGLPEWGDSWGNCPGDERVPERGSPSSAVRTRKGGKR